MARSATTRTKSNSRSRRSSSGGTAVAKRRGGSTGVARNKRSTDGSATRTTGFRTYRSAMAYLKSFVNYEDTPRIDYTPKNFSLDRARKILAALKRPDRNMRTVHIAGTKGKGSTATMVACMLQNCGYKVGLYTSPHLISLRERMSVNGRHPTEQEFVRTLNKVAAAVRKATTRSNPPTFFEVMTAIAFIWFADEEVDIAVVEAGLGGRLDTTNVIQPEVCAITSISFDHVPQLGNTLSAIATEKAGIIKKGIPVICSPQRAEVAAILRERAERMEAPICFPVEDHQFSYRFESSREVGPHTRLSLTTSRSRFEHLHVPLPGEHQAINCSVALSVVDTLKGRGLAIDDQKAIEGLASVRMSGRMEMVSEEPRVLVDGAHNASSVEALMRAIGQNVPYDSMIVIFACNKDKDIGGMLRHVQLGADKVIFTSAQTAKSADPFELLHTFQEKYTKMAQAADTLEGAMEIACSAITREDLICITGSFYIVGRAKRLFKKIDEI